MNEQIGGEVKGQKGTYLFQGQKGTYLFCQLFASNIGSIYSGVLSKLSDTKVLKKLLSMSKAERAFAKAGASGYDITVAVNMAKDAAIKGGGEVDALEYGLSLRGKGYGEEVEILADIIEYGEANPDSEVNTLLSEFAEETAVDKTSRSAIMRLGAGNDETESPYDVLVDKESVAKETERIKSNLGISMLRLDKLENSTVLTKLVDVTENLQREHGARYNAIIAENMPDGDIAYVNPSRELHINAKYFNSPEAMRDKLTTLVKSSFIPKGCNNINYVSMHEYMHLLTMSEIDKPHSEIVNLYEKAKKQVKRGKLVSVGINSMQDAYEFAADYLSLPWENKITIKLKKILGWS